VGVQRITCTRTEEGRRLREGEGRERCERGYLEGHRAPSPVGSVHCREPSRAERREILDLVARNLKGWGGIGKERTGLRSSRARRRVRGGWDGRRWNRRRRWSLGLGGRNGQGDFSLAVKGRDQSVGDEFVQTACDQLLNRGVAIAKDLKRFASLPI
jgi:hypothetical protein